MKWKKRERNKNTFLHGLKLVMKHSDSAIKHLDGTIYARKMSSHYKESSVLEEEGSNSAMNKSLYQLKPLAEKEGSH